MLHTPPSINPFTASEALKTFFDEAASGMRRSDSLPPTMAPRRSLSRSKEPRESSIRGDPLQAEEFEENHEVMMASHVKDMLSLYERAAPVDMSESEDREMQWGQFQRQCHKLVRSRRFDYFFTLLILVDTILIGVEVDLEEHSELVFGLLTLLSIAFAVELVVRAAAEPHKAMNRLLLFDAILIFVSMLEILSRAINAPVDLIFMRGLRVFRLLRLLKVLKPAKRLPPLHLLLETITRSLHPLMIVLTISGILIFAFAVMLTNLVPDTEDDDVREVALLNFGSVITSSRWLLEVMHGSGACSTDALITLYVAAQNGRPGAVSILMASFLASFVLFLALSGLVTGVFIEQLFGVTNRADEAIQQQALLKSHESLTMLDQMFSAMGYNADDPITWAEVERGLESNICVKDRLDIDLQDAYRLFLHIDEDNDGSVGTDEFIFGIFKLKTISKSIDMLSIDYQQEKALQRLADLHTTLRLSIAGIQSRLTGFASLLPIMEKKICDVTVGIDEVQKLEEDLVHANKVREDATAQKAGKTPGWMSSELTVEMLRSNHQLNGQLTSLEEEFKRLKSLGEGLPTSKDEAVASIADAIVQSIKQTMLQELEAAKAAPPSRII